MIKMNFVALILVAFAALFVGALTGAYLVAVYSIKLLERLETEHQDEMEKETIGSYYEGFQDGKKAVLYSSTE